VEPNAHIAHIVVIEVTGFTQKTKKKNTTVQANINTRFHDGRVQVCTPTEPDWQADRQAEEMLGAA
jgi:hypothetical protein